jgi:hypothetical protein
MRVIFIQTFERGMGLRYRLELDEVITQLRKIKITN